MKPTFVWAVALATLLCGSSETWGQSKTPMAPQPMAPQQTSPQQISFSPGGFNQTPWFNNPQVRQQLKINDTQFSTLNQAYASSWADYQRNALALSPNLSDTQRQQSMAALQQGLAKGFSTTPQKHLTGADQLQRFNQLHWQFRGFDAFSDPVVIQKLNLTMPQRAKLNDAQQEWSMQLNKLTPIFNVHQEDAIRRFNMLQDQNAGRLDSVLTPDQRKAWQEMIGNPYMFNPRVYFPPPSTTPNGQ